MARAERDPRRFLRDEERAATRRLHELGGRLAGKLPVLERDALVRAPIRSHPRAALLAAGAGGFLTARLLPSRSRRRGEGRRRGDLRRLFSLGRLMSVARLVEATARLSRSLAGEGPAPGAPQGVPPAAPGAQPPST